ncbi:MAG: hypothetical protein V1660_02210 [archaeon]
MGKKEALDCKISKIIEDIREIKEETVKIRNRLQELFPIFYSYHAPLIRLIKGAENLSPLEVFNLSQLGYHH